MSEFILINLNQTVNRAALREQKREAGRWVIFAVYTLCFIGIGYGFYSFQSDLTRLVDARNDRITNVKNQIDALKEDEGIDLSKADIESLYDWKSNRILWADKLNILSEITPDHMAITEINYQNDRVTITAVSRVFTDLKDFNVIENFINTLKGNEIFNNDFIDIKFLSSDRFISRGQEVLTFRIEANSKNTKKKRGTKRKRKGRA